MIDQILVGSYAKQQRGGPSPRELRVLNWNIERGERLSGVMDFIRRLRPDLCILQEVDLYAKRTGRKHIADVLASNFDFNYAFGIEFEELSQGSDTKRAFTGQAVLARSPITLPRILRFSRQSNIWHPRWFLPRWPPFQPRRGGRMALVVELPVAEYPLVVYDLHLESQSDDNLRLWQLSEIVQDSLRYPARTPIVVAGDLNTRRAPSPLRQYFLAAGFRDACDYNHCPPTKANGQTLDWIFTRGPAVCSWTRVHQEVRASDHYPLSTKLTLTG